VTQLEFDGHGQPAPGVEPPASPLPPREQLMAWRERIPSLVRFGTSTWTYPGWAGLVYSQRYPEQGASAKMLAEYARFPLFSTVGIDSSFYGPPRPKTLEGWARALPEGFRCVSKVWDRLTVHTFAGKREPRSLAGKANPDFLNPNLFLAEVYQPFREHFGAHTGPFVFEFQTMAGLGPRGAEEFADRLDAFFGILPRDAQYAVELRNEEFLTPAYLTVLREHNVAHVFNSWTRMPSIGTQLDVPGVITADFIVSRALLRPGRLYADAVKAFSPYDRIRDPNPELRSDLVRLARTAERLRIPAWLIVNNRAEGSAPHTIAALAQVLAESPADTTTPRA
jgi:uncharacterized protein YecE (DUF72 family)